jgi:hypothetical protein
MMNHTTSRYPRNVIPAIGRNDFSRKRESMLTLMRWLSMGSRLRENDGLWVGLYRTLKTP